MFTSQSTSGSPRILLHSHDSYGLGHLRRTTTLAEALSRTFRDARILIATGSPCATHFPLPAGVDTIKLPSATKDSAGDYVPRQLGRDLSPVLQLRRRLLSEIHASFDPDLLIVDHQVLGLGDELDDVLRQTRRTGTRTILGVRDIIDTPEAVEREWGRPRARQALASEYDRVCVYGTPEVFDPRVEYPIPTELRERLEFTGYIARPRTFQSKRPSRSKRANVLVTVGGGEDGADRVETYLDCLDLGAAEWDTTIVLGPLVPPRRARALKRRVAGMRGIDLHLFYGDMPRLLSHATAVVSMAGYNSVVEILQSRRPTVLCPRSFPRREQLIRAERMAALGLAHCLPAPRPADLRAAVEAALAQGRVTPDVPDLNGTARLCAIARELVASRQHSHLHTAAR